MVGINRESRLDGESVVWPIRIVVLGVASAAVVISASLSVAQVERVRDSEALRRGLEMWRKPDAKGAACISCHSPDGIEIATYDFDDATITRRAMPHHGPEGAAVLVRYIHALRDSHRIEPRLDPMTCPPMQPGGTALPGESPEERDLAFGRTLPSVLPALMGRPIDSLPSAKEALVEVLSIDVRKVKIGIPLNRLSEDEFHGREHASVANWLPDVPIGLPPGRLAKLEDAYLSSPTDSALRELLIAFRKECAKPRSPAEQLGQAKFRALILLQHELRGDNKLATIAEPIALYGDPKVGNPMWEVAEVGRQNGDTALVSLGLPEDIAAKKSSGPALREQMRQLRVSWYWCGWMMDQGLHRSGALKETPRADYFSQTLLDDGPYPIHCAFMLTRKLAVEGSVPSTWIGPGPQRIDPNYTFLVLRDNLTRFEPKNAEARRLFQTFMCNSFRMMALLFADELERIKAIGHPKQGASQQLRLMGEYVAKCDPLHALADAALFRRANAALDAAKISDPGGDTHSGTVQPGERRNCP